jgi:hypothetical protein
MGDCDRSKLTSEQTRGVDGAAHRRNLSFCTDSLESCNYSALTSSEAETFAKAERQGNYTACLKGLGYCDRSRLTSAEAGAISNPTRGNSPVKQRKGVRRSLAGWFERLLAELNFELWMSDAAKIGSNQSPTITDRSGRHLGCRSRRFHYDRAYFGRNLEEIILVRQRGPVPAK